MTEAQVGKLLLVTTPIGTVDDLSPRGRKALEQADLIACEDTRRTGRLCQRLGLKRPLLSLHEHNESGRIPRILERLEQGETIALVSDAGTPLVSDPGFRLVRAVLDQRIALEAVPGPSAVLAALVLSGLGPQPFTFAGFPPPKRGKRRRFYRELAALPHTLVIFESPHRILSSLEDALEELGDRPCALARELTKRHEEVLRGALSDVLEQVRERDSLRGEITLVFDRPPKS